jgi:endonuclease III-like uncharacterized protein
MASPASRQNGSDRVREIARRLSREHPPSRKVRRDPLDELLLTVLSQSTSDANCYAAWEALRDRYPDWDAVLDAPDDEVEETIRPAGLAKQSRARSSESSVGFGGSRRTGAGSRWTDWRRCPMRRPSRT